MEFDKNKFITVELDWGYRTSSPRDVYKFDDMGIYYTNIDDSYGGSTWCSYSSGTEVLYNGKRYPLNYRTMSELIPAEIEKKYGAEEDYIELDDIVL